MNVSIWTGLLLATLAVAAIWDVRAFRIPNPLSVIVLVLFVGKALISGLEAPFLAYLASAAVTFTITAILFYNGVFGGGGGFGDFCFCGVDCRI